MKRGNVPAHLKEPYVPEWMRLNKNPLPADLPIEDRAKARNTFDQKVFKYHNQRVKPDEVEEPRVLSEEEASELNEKRIPMPVKEPPPVQFNQLKRQNNPPIPVHIGVHEEQMWADERSFVPKKSEQRKAVQPDFEDDQVDVEALQGISEFDDVCYDDQNNDNEISVQDQAQEPIYKQDAFLQENEFALIVRGKIIKRFFDIEQVKRAVENIVIDHDISVSEVEVYHRVQLGFGVIIK